MTDATPRLALPSPRQLTARIPPTLAWILFALATVVAWDLADPGHARQRMDWFLQDRWIARRTPPDLHREILLVLEDDLAAEQLGQTDSRHRRARALRQLGSLGARTVVFDYLLHDSGSDVSFYEEEAPFDGVPVDLFDELPDLTDAYREDALQQHAFSALVSPDAELISTILPCFFRRPPTTAAGLIQRLVDELVEQPLKHQDAESLATATNQDLTLVQEHLDQACWKAARQLAADETLASRVINAASPLLANHVRRAKEKTRASEFLTRSSFPDSGGRSSTARKLDRLSLPLLEFMNDTTLAFVDIEPTRDFMIRRFRCLNSFSLPTGSPTQQGSSRQLVHQSLAATLLQQGYSISNVQKLESGELLLSPSETSRVPLDRRGRLIINWPLHDQASWQSQLETLDEEEQPSQFIRLSELMHLAELERDHHTLQVAVRRLATTLDEALQLSLGCQAAVRDIREQLVAFVDGEANFPLASIASFEATLARGVLDHKATRELLDGTRDPTGAKTLLHSAQELDRLLNQDLDRQRQALDTVRKELDRKVRGKLCLVGQIKTGSTDIHNTPVGRLPGIIVNAAAINTLLTRDFLSSQSAGAAILVTVMVMVIVGILFAHLNVVPATVSVIPLMLLVSWVHEGLLTWNNTVTRPVLPLVGIVVCFAAVTIRKWWQDNLTRRKVRRAFEFYLHPAVVKRVAEDPAELQLGGSATEVSILFSDIRGFTSIAERLPDEELTTLLNEYLTAMTAIVFDNNGTVDKYIGDAIMAFYGAPITDESHPLQACRTAIQMSGQLDVLRHRWRERGLPAIRIGIGINTDVVRVGNFGSDLRFDYTIIGDGVNLASRLEGANKQYGTELLISEGTWSRVRDRLVTRELDLIQVKGRQRPARIFELLGELPQEPELTDRVARFEAALSVYRDRNFADALTEFLALAEEDPQDVPSRMYAERCRQLLENPPPEHWDGVFVMTSK